jgi:serine protease Do
MVETMRVGFTPNNRTFPAWLMREIARPGLSFGSATMVKLLESNRQGTPKMSKHLLTSACAGFAGALLAVGFAGWSSPSLQARPLTAEERVIPDRAMAMLEMTSEVIEAASDLVAPAVVSVESRQRGSDGKTKSEDFGSGVIYRPLPDAEPLVITNLHVLGDAELKDIDIFLADGRAFHPTRVWKDHDTDLALLGLPVSDVPTAKLADSEKSRIGQWVLVVGSPFGLSHSITHGIISAKNRRQVGMPGNVRIKEFLQTDAAINPGNSGGPLVNLRGEVLGINTAIASYTGKNSGVGFAIPANIVKWVAKELVTHGKVRRSFLGVSFPHSFTPEIAQTLGLSSVQGAFVGTVHAKSPAAVAGVKQNDVILEFDGMAIDDENHLINTVARSPIGKSAEIVVWRNKAKVKLQAKLTEWTE